MVRYVKRGITAPKMHKVLFSFARHAHKVNSGDTFMTNSERPRGSVFHQSGTQYLTTTLAVFDIAAKIVPRGFLYHTLSGAAQLLPLLVFTLSSARLHEPQGFAQSRTA